MTKRKGTSKDWKEYYEEKSILDEVTDEPVDLSLRDTLREEILIFSLLFRSINKGLK